MTIADIEKRNRQIEKIEAEHFLNAADSLRVRLMQDFLREVALATLADKEACAIRGVAWPLFAAKILESCAIDFPRHCA